MKRLIAAGIGMLLALTAALTAPAAHAAFGTRTTHCRTDFKQARAVLRGAITGIDANALQLTCGQKSIYGSHYIRWTGTPHPSFIARGLSGSLQHTDVTWGPEVTRVVRQRMSPWQFPKLYDPSYLAWIGYQALLGHEPLYRPVMVVHSYTARICTLTVWSSRLCSDMDLKTQNKYGYGLRVCIVAPGPKCGEWKRFS